MRCSICGQPIAKAPAGAYYHLVINWTAIRRGTTHTAQPSDPFAGIDENTESDASRPAVS